MLTLLSQYRGFSNGVDAESYFKNFLFQLDEL